MAFDNVRAEIGILLAELQQEPPDKHAIHQQLVDKLAELRAFGLPIPDDLVELEKALEAEFAADSAGGAASNEV